LRRPTETVTEENYYFKLSAFQKPLLDFTKGIRLSFSRKRAKMNYQFRRRRLEGFEHYAHHSSLGYPRAW